MAMAGHPGRRGIAQRFRTSAVSRAHQCRPQLAFAHRLDEFAHSVAHPGFDRIESVVEQINCRFGGKLRGSKLRGSDAHGVVSSPTLLRRTIRG